MSSALAEPVKPTEPQGPDERPDTVDEKRYEEALPPAAPEYPVERLVISRRREPAAG